MKLTELNSFRLSDAVKFHDQLNPVIFDDEKMDPVVRQQLLVIAQDFMDHMGVSNLDIMDIVLTGSNAAYTYTDHSDLDLHIIVDIELLKNDEVYRELFTAKKTVYNDTHDIKIHGYDVELYVEDSREPAASLGTYSVKNDRWVKFPGKRRSNFDESAARHKFIKLVQLSELALRSDDVDKLDNLLDTIRKYRQAGLDSHGEFGPENLAFKALRSQGIIQQLYDHRGNLHDIDLSLAEETKLNTPTLNVEALAKLHGVSEDHIRDQLLKGIGVELEHTDDPAIADEIARDHIKEDPRYYTKLSKVGLEEVQDFEELPNPIYHVTPSANLASIMRQGLIPQKGSRSSKILDEKPAIYCFPDKNTMEDAVMNWLGDEFDEDEALALLEINTMGLDGQVTSSAGYEIAITSRIPAENIKILSKDLTMSLNEGASGYIPSEKEKNDPRFKTALTVDIKPDSIKKNAKKLGLGNITRSGVPPTASASGKF